MRHISRKARAHVVEKKVILDIAAMVVPCVLVRTRSCAVFEVPLASRLLRHCPLSLQNVGLLEERVAPRRKLPPLLSKLQERPPETLHYLGVSFGLTNSLLTFWKRAGFVPVYLSQKQVGLGFRMRCSVWLSVFVTTEFEHLKIAMPRGPASLSQVVQGGNSKVA